MSATDVHPNLFVTFIVFFIIGSISAYYASRQGRNPFLWFALGVLLGIFAPLILFFLSILDSRQAKSVVPPPSEHLKEPLAGLNPILSEIKQQEAERLNPDSDANKLWYYLDQDHVQQGPVSLLALKELWDSGRLYPTAYVWSKGMQQWKRVQELSNLRAELDKPPL